MSATYFDRLEDELRAAVPRAAATSQRSRVSLRGSRPRTRDLALVLGVALALAVVAVSAVLLRHGRDAARAPAGQNPSRLHRHPPGVAPGEVLYPLGAVPTLSQLRENFAVLRRPQTEQDRGWQPRCDCARSARQLTGLTRFARALPGGYRVFLDVQQLVAGGQLNMAAGSYVLNLDVVDPRGNVSGAAFGPNVNFTVFPIQTTGPVWASIVPDGVASVSWTFGCPVARRGSCTGSAARTITVPVVGNVAAALMTGKRCFVRGVFVCARATGVIWRSSRGVLVASFTGFTNLPAAPFVLGSRASGQVRALLPNAVAGVRLGEAWPAATTALTRLLGSPADAGVAGGGCGVDHESVWTSPAVADPLTIFERDGRFAGYLYGAPASEIALQRGPGAVLLSGRGLSLGDTVGRLRQLYGATVRTTAAHGGRWTARGDGGSLSGSVLPQSYPLRRVRESNPVATIEAGRTGCLPSGS